MSKRVVLLVGTAKGAFFYHSDENRREWRMTGPHLNGWEVYSLHGNRDGRIFAGTGHWVYGTTIRVSDDLGETWTEIVDGPKYPEGHPSKLKRIWQIVSHPTEPRTMLAGVEDGGLFVSRDGGESWSENGALSNHPTRPDWFPGGGGLCLHTIVVDPRNANRWWIGISAVGCFRTDDGGASWSVKNQGIHAVPTGQPDTGIGRCVHKFVLDPEDSNTLYMQFHGGVFRSTDGADSWQPIEEGLPGNFGFPMVITQSGTRFTVPLHEEARVAFDGKLTTYRMKRGESSWSPAGKGLPAEPQYVGVLRDSMDVDPLSPGGVYFGTTMGEVFYSPDEGESWDKLPGQLPRITSVKAWVTG